jgi:hypothetical protein
MRQLSNHRPATLTPPRWTGRPVSLALIALIMLFLAWLIFSNGNAVTAQTGGGYHLTQSAISAGGGELTGGRYILAGTLGQPDAGALSGGNYTLGGGFWGGSGGMVHIYLPLVARNH